MNCPRCGATGPFRRLEMDDQSTGCLILFLGGILPFLLYDSSKKDKVVCARCGYAFTLLPPGAARRRFLFVAITLGLALLVIVAVCLSKK